ncbi:MAG TPA: Lsr2 family protein [Propionibacteriaceae bacterium]|nr:Lsr2 family protein [Propionibacteriaceae bacterium]
MAQRVRVELVDDIDGSVADETISLTFEGVSYEIDLSGANAAKFRETLAPWLGNARRTGGRKSAGRKPATGVANDVRAWALSQGMQVSSRGRVPAAIREAYELAHA